ncbi:hypothetical protein TRIP_B170098 [uncultured Desulfatiglans sp.]|nr:hypothetical protein TRIP_B170098 [uncultured Desulfatiglans sp.]
MSTSHIQLVSRDSIPGHSLLVGDERYRWVPDYIRLQDLRREAKRLREQKRLTRNAALAREELLAELRVLFDGEREKRVTAIRQHIISDIRQRGRSGGRDLPGWILGRVAMDRWPPAVDFSEVEAAVADIEGEIFGETLAEREAELEAIEERLAEITTEINELSPDRYFLIGVGGKVIGDVRDDFVAHWRRLQRSCRTPAGPQGYALRLSQPEEADAYRALGIGKFVNERGDAPAAHPGHGNG